MTLFSGLAAAIEFMTRIPMPPRNGAAPPDLADAAPFLPVAGLLVGATVSAGLYGAEALGPSVAALLGTLLWVMVTGAMHLDGLGDVADGLGAAHRDPNRFLEVARDPHLGAFGAIAIMVQLLAKVVLLAELSLSAMFIPLLLVPAWARWGTLILAQNARPLTDGMSQRLAKGVTLPISVMSGAVLAAVSFAVAPVLLLSIPLPFLSALFWRRRLGGITGDCHGASIEVAETALLLALVVGGR